MDFDFEVCKSFTSNGGYITYSLNDMYIVSGMENERLSETVK